MAKHEPWKDHGPGVYLVEGGFSASITHPEGHVHDLGVFKTRDEAGAAYIKAQHEMYPPPPPPPPGTKVHNFAAPDLVARKPKVG